MSKTNLKRHLRKSKAALRKIESTLCPLNHAPAFKGKARIIDKLLAARIHLVNLSWELEQDIKGKTYLPSRSVKVRV